MRSRVDATLIAATGSPSLLRTAKLAGGAVVDVFAAAAELALLAADRGAWGEAGGHARQAQALVEETRLVRVWGGIHFRNTLEVSDVMGREVAAYLVANSIRPIR